MTSSDTKSISDILTDVQTKSDVDLNLGFLDYLKRGLFTLFIIAITVLVLYFLIRCRIFCFLFNCCGNSLRHLIHLAGQRKSAPKPAMAPSKAARTVVTKPDMALKQQAPLRQSPVHPSSR